MSDVNTGQLPNESNVNRVKSYHRVSALITGELPIAPEFSSVK